ncbi:DUF305 domain-containing protein [Marinactinospora thermotolerans]|uniref:Uncharacterized conserved protein, DUF305 family n=1 Tax=Marinactinospora thermotolerans DSM 45154 TaxID=1122192 RepID=A0A1T4PPH7_9ACTN|nr:DUF305 domain-containing protein [Marinactinospora thermotolerans]SJZ93329.1 Uncharacterized conserved protein, DUF305 family [Marinactinospora thermotolerans DSM 45154]
MFEYKRVLMLPSALVAALSLASCGGADQGAPPPAPEASQQTVAEFNDADVMFARMMIPHHEQAVEMSRLAEERAGGEVRELAAQIEAAQGPEIEHMNRLLESWGEDPTAQPGHMDHGGMDGMLSKEQMADLEQASGDDFDTLFLRLMIEHHEGAVDMAEGQLAEGVDPEATRLAREIVDTQEGEIAQMSRMLGEDSGRDGGPATGDEASHGDH